MEYKCRSIRSVSGYDVSEASIYNIYKSLGGTKSMRQLDEIEKRLLRIIALQEQMEATGAVNDFEKTITNASNQLKQLTETFKEIGRWIGQLTMKFIAPWVEKLLAGTIALREMLKSLNVAMGYFYKDYSKEGTGHFGNSKKNAKELLGTIVEINGVLLGFDKLNILGSGSTNSKNADYQYLIDKMKEYSNSLTQVENQANSIASKILEWAGFTYNAKEDIWKFNDTLDTTADKIGYVFDKINEAFLMLISKILDKAPQIITTAIDVILGTTQSLFEYIPKLVSTFMEKLIKPISENLPAIGTFMNEFVLAIYNGLIGTIFEISGDILNELPKIISNNAVDMPEILLSSFRDLFSIMLPGVLAEVTKFLIRIIEFVATLIPKLLTTIVSGLSNGDGFLSKEFWQKFSESFSKGWGMEGFAGEVSNQWKESMENISSSWGGLGDIFAPFGDKIGELFSNIGKKFKDIWIEIKDWFGNTIVPTLGNFFINMINSVIDGFEKMVNFFIRGINKITSGLSSAWTWLGIPAIGKINEVSFNKIPALANGGVIDSPTMALVGEYAGASSNPEIVTPENLMREVFIESMLPIAQAIVSGDREVVNAIQDLANRPVELNGRKISENIYSDLQKVAMRKGQTMFASAR